MYARNRFISKCVEFVSVETTAVITNVEDKVHRCGQFKSADRLKGCGRDFLTGGWWSRKITLSLLFVLLKSRLCPLFGDYYDHIKILRSFFDFANVQTSHTLLEKKVCRIDRLFKKSSRNCCILSQDKPFASNFDDSEEIGIKSTLFVSKFRTFAKMAGF